MRSANIFIKVLCIYFGCFIFAGQLFAQNIKTKQDGKLLLFSSPEAFKCQGWQMIALQKNDTTPIGLKLLTKKDGQYLNWSNPNKNGNIALEMFKAKSPINSQDSVEVCSIGIKLCFFKLNSYSLLKLKADAELMPGIYAVRVNPNASAASSTGEAICSNFIVIEIK